MDRNQLNSENVSSIILLLSYSMFFNFRLCSNIFCFNFYRLYLILSRRALYWFNDWAFFYCRVFTFFLFNLCSSLIMLSPLFNMPKCFSSCAMLKIISFFRFWSICIDFRNYFFDPIADCLLSLPWDTAAESALNFWVILDNYLNFFCILKVLDFYLTFSASFIF